MIYQVTSGDKGYVFRDILTVDGAPVDLQGKTVKFVLRAGAVESEWDAAPDLATSGLANFTVADLNPPFPTVIGDYQQRWRVYEGNTFRLSHPNDRWNDLRIGP